MSLWKCSACHHEWESANRYFDTCGWCGEPGTTLEIKTAFERWLHDDERRTRFWMRCKEKLEMQLPTGSDEKDKTKSSEDNQTTREDEQT